VFTLDRADAAKWGGKIADRGGESDNTTDAPREAKRHDPLKLLFECEHGFEPSAISYQMPSHR
jgi:hypothetical protein